MSTLGGIYNFDGAPVDERLLIALGNGLASRAPDGGGGFRRGSLGMVYRAFHTTKESRQETQPLISSDGQVLCWDGRLDNRDELIPLLRDELNDDYTDVAIVMAARRRWKDDFLPRIIGDFALSLWDANTRTLLLARDPAGPRSLFYQANQERIIWSSELSPLLGVVSGRLKVNDEYVATHLIGRPDPGVTPYQGIYAVAPGNVVILRNGKLQARWFWKLDPQREIRYRTDAEYEEHFRRLFREAVRCRMRVDGPVWATLSGGLDSSAIVCMADEIMESGEAEASKLETVSYVYGESTSSDERNFIDCVEEKRGRKGHYLWEEDYPPLASFPEPSDLSFPDFLDCFVDRHRGLCEAMCADGTRVLLTGHGGDEMLCSNPSPAPALGDLLVRSRLLTLHRSLQIWSGALKKSYFNLLWRDGVILLLPRRVQITCGLKPNFELPPWFDEQFVLRMKLHERNLGVDDVFGFALPSGRDQSIGFLSAMRTIAKASYRARGRIEVSHPYLHRPLVEFLQAIPFEQRVRPGENRSLMRRALRDLLPENVLNRKTKKGPDEAMFRAITREWSRLQPIFENSRVCAFGYANAEALLAALERARHGCLRHSFALVQTISLEFWLRSMEHNGDTAKICAASAEPKAMLTMAQPAPARVARHFSVQEDTR
jgi:asparagine synthase (glutamine-hydrolysing)